MTQQQEKEYTWDDLKAAIGEDFSGGEIQTSADPVEAEPSKRLYSRNTSRLGPVC